MPNDLDPDIAKAIVELKTRIPDPVDVTIAIMVDQIIHGHQKPIILVRYMLRKGRSKVEVLQKLRGMTASMISG